MRATVVLMMNNATSRPRLLLVDDEPTVRAIVMRFAERHGFETIACADGHEALDVLRTGDFHLALIDVRLPNVCGIDVLKAVRETVPGCQVILMSGIADVDVAIQAIRLGAMDYLSKPLDFGRLTQLFGEVREAVSARATTKAAGNVADFHGLVGSSARMEQVSTSIRRLAPYARTALIVGETGTGKELAARALHACGPRARERFVTINCSAVVETLFESELFGHVKGAFTGAVADKAGLFEQAHRGTLFLDEIGELPLSMQAKLLRVLESGELLRVGALQAKTVDVHIVAATNRDLRAEVAAGRFRQDLLFRVNMIEVSLPPLRDRRDDVPVLAGVFLERFARRMRKNLTGFTPEAEAGLRASHWPGNVRELRNVIERACIVADGERVGVDDLAIESPVLLAGASTARPSGVDGAAAPRAARSTLKVIERDQLLLVLGEVQGNKAKAAEALGISRRALYRRLEKHGLDRAIQRRDVMPDIITGMLAQSAA